jgi:hypothetical protein
MPGLHRLIVEHPAEAVHGALVPAPKLKLPHQALAFPYIPIP